MQRSEAIIRHALGKPMADDKDYTLVQALGRSRWQLEREDWKFEADADGPEGENLAVMSRAKTEPAPEPPKEPEAEKKPSPRTGFAKGKLAGLVGRRKGKE